MTRKTLIILIILTLAIVGIVLVLVKPAVPEIKDLRQEISLKKADLNRLNDFLQKFEVLKGQYEEEELKVEKLYQVLPEKPDIPGILVQLETLASENGLLLEDMDYSLPVVVRGELAETLKKEAFQKIVFDLQVAGAYKAFEKFLEALENNLRLMDVSDIGLSATVKEAEGGETTISYTYNLTMNVYYQE